MDLTNIIKNKENEIKSDIEQIRADQKVLSQLTAEKAERRK